MKKHSLSLALGIGVLIAASLFTYSRTQTFDAGSRMTWTFDGATFSMLILCITLFIVCRRIARVVNALSHRAGVAEDLSISKAVRLVIVVAIPFLLVGYGWTHRIEGLDTTFAFGMSSFKLPVFLLVILLAWMIALLQRLHLLSGSLPEQASTEKRQA